MVNRPLLIGTACMFVANMFAPVAFAQKSDAQISDILSGKSTDQKAEIKSEQVAVDTELGLYEKGDLSIDLLGVSVIDGGVEVFAKAWEDGESVGFGADGTVEIERFRVFNPPILVEDPTGTVVRTYVDVGTKKQSKFGIVKIQKKH